MNVTDKQCANLQVLHDPQNRIKDLVFITQLCIFWKVYTKVLNIYIQILWFKELT